MGIFQMLMLAWFLLLIGLQWKAESQPVESVSTRSTRAEGALLCGKVPAKGVYVSHIKKCKMAISRFTVFHSFFQVRLFKINSDGMSMAMATNVLSIS